MSNVSILSEWHARGDRQALTALLRQGDLIEMDRGNYAHWAVYVGLLPTATDLDGDDIEVLEHMVVHMANPGVGAETGQGGAARSPSSDSLSMVLSSSSSSRATATGETICTEKLMDVWFTGLARINNSFDREMPPFPADEVVSRALHAVGNPTGLQRLPYNLLTNNCEHFATHVRNGWGVSAQVARGVRKLGHVATVFGLALLPRPLLMAAGLGYLAHQAVTQGRRASRASPGTAQGQEINAEEEEEDDGMVDFDDPADIDLEDNRVDINVPD